MINEKELQVESNQSWTYAISIVCILIIAYGFFYSTNDVKNLAFLLGQCSVYAIVITGFLSLFFKKGEKRPNVGLAFVFILISLIIANLIGAKRQEMAFSEFASETKANINEIISLSEDEEGMPQRIEKKIEENSRSSGTPAKLEVLAKSNMNKIIALKNDYLLELEAIGWSSILDFQRIKEDKTLMKSKAIISNANYIMSKYRNKNYALFEEMRNDILELDVPEKQRNEILAGFDDSMSKGLKDTELQWKLEEEIFLEFEKIITLLSAKNGTWEIADDQIYFATDEDVNSYINYVNNIQSLVAKQEELQSQAAQNLNDKLDKMIK